MRNMHRIWQIDISNISIFHSFVFYSLSRGGRGKINNRLVTDQKRFKSEAGHRIFVCNYVFYEHPQLYFKLTMQFRSAVFGFMNQL